jgi:hypothetical protein
MTYWLPNWLNILLGGLQVSTLNLPLSGSIQLGLKLCLSNYLVLRIMSLALLDCNWTNSVLICFSEIIELEFSMPFSLEMAFSKKEIGCKKNIDKII